MRRAVVLCTLPLSEAGQHMLNEVADIVVAPNPNADTLRAMLADVDLLIVRTHLPADLLERPHRLIGIVRHGAGLDMIPVAAATAQNIPVANVPGANAQSVAEYCAGSFIALARRFSAMDRDLRAQGWTVARGLSDGTNELASKTVGIVGVGATGTALARICHYGFGMRVLGYQPSTRSFPDFVERSDLGDLLQASDFVSLHCPLTPETRLLFNAARLAQMKPTAFLVNAARGEIVDEAALARALAEGGVRGAAIDVFSRQPLAPDHPFLTLDNVILTPHAAALTRESVDRMSIKAVQQVLQLLAGTPPDHLVNPEVWPRRRRWTGPANDLQKEITT
ncbi:hydroxyacid dehydrogenase [Parapusillimonas sp. SGNA-6]|nr:hydroxyacid dehydrogenase [Parapusillimonas sp. SGNA-6]